MNDKKIVAYGEIMMRLSSPSGAIESSTSFDACYGGTEANVLACLSRFGRRTEYLTALPDNGLGRATLDHLHSFGVGTGNVVVNGDTLGLYFTESGNGSRGANVVYYRKGSEFAKLDERSFDLDKAFDGAALFHISGISFALSESSRRLAFALLDAARARGVKISFDFNYRAKLWSVDAAREQLLKAVEYADIVLASDIDLAIFLRTDAIGFLEKYPARYLAVRNRKPIDDVAHSVNVTLYENDGGFVKKHASPEIKFNVVERVGGGDAFDGALLHKLLDGADVKSAVEFALAAFVLKHSVKGDTFTLGADEVEKFIPKLGAL